MVALRTKLATRVSIYICEIKSCSGSLLPVLGVRNLVTFHLMYVYIILVRFRLLFGNLLGNNCSLG